MDAVPAIEERVERLFVPRRLAAETTLRASE
jgi:hypothetical protein